MGSIRSIIFGAVRGSKKNCLSHLPTVWSVMLHCTRAVLIMHSDSLHIQWVWSQWEWYSWLVSLSVSVSSVGPTGPLLLLLHHVFNMQEQRGEHSVCVNWWSWLHIRMMGSASPPQRSLLTTLSLSLSLFHPLYLVLTYRLSFHVEICKHTDTHSPWKLNRVCVCAPSLQSPSD